MRSPTQTRIEDLPQELAVFPLGGALLLPGGRLPLNIFEPRYLNMTLDALAEGRIFGMIQPDNEKSRSENEPAVYSVGCAGRVASFEETDDGRLLIVLKGLSRFRVLEEIEGRKGYRRMRVSYGDFKADMEPPPKIEVDREMLFARLKPYLDVQGMRVNMDAVKALDDVMLVTSLAMMCPFDPREKQALLEAADLKARGDMLLTLLQMGAFDTAKPDGRPQ